MSRSRSRLREQAVVVARVQADARLVEDVEHADEPAADLAGQADALGLAAGERRGGAVERQVVQADVEQEAEPAADLLEHFVGDRLLDAASSRSRARQLGRTTATSSPIGMRADFDERLAADADGPGLRVEPLALAGRAAHHAHVLFELHPPRAGRRLLELPAAAGRCLPTCRRASRRRRRAASTRRRCAGRRCRGAASRGAPPAASSTASSGRCRATCATPS